MPLEHPLTWLEPGDNFPHSSLAWPSASDAPGLLAAGGSLDAPTLVKAYSQGIFPWYSKGQPTLWWSPDPRMVLQTTDFKLHRSLKKAIRGFLHAGNAHIRFDSAFAQVITGCAAASRRGQAGTWILPEMVAAYVNLHHQGYAHSIETWIDGELVGGLYCVAIGRAVFGESMFSLRTDASKIALAALISFCRESGIEMIDCQQNTPHLASMGAREMPREPFIGHVQRAITKPPATWQFAPLYWQHTLDI